MKIFIIGKNGQLGSELVAYSKKLGYNTFSFGSKDLDITDYNAVREKIEDICPDVVINTAAYHVVSDCEKHPEIAFSVNSAAEKNLAVVCKDNNAKLVYLSTDKVFDGKARKPYTEKDRTNPVQVYGISKLAGELSTLNYTFNSLVVRTCGIFGGTQGSSIKGGNFVLYILKQAKIKKEIEISSEQVASFIYASDLAKAILDLIAKDVTGIYNLVQGHSSWARFASEIVKIRKLSLKIIPIDRKGEYGTTPIPIFAALDARKTVREGIVLRDWKESLKEYLDFLKKNGI